MDGSACTTLAAKNGLEAENATLLRSSPCVSRGRTAGLSHLKLPRDAQLRRVFEAIAA